MVMKTTTYTALVLLLLGLLTACSGKTPTSSTVNLPNVKNSSNPTAAVTNAYPATNANQNNGAYPAANAVQSQATESSAYPAAVAAPLSVAKTDGTAVSLSPTDLAALPKKSVTAGKKDINGITVVSILAKAGITDYKQITFVGANGSQTLTKDKIDANIILTINPDGTLQLVSPNLTEDQWIKSVNTIKAE